MRMESKIRGRSLASIRRARQKENREIKEEKQEYKPVKRDVLYS